MGLREIEDVDVIADAGAVRRLVIGAEDRDMLLLAERDFQDVRNEVRFDAVILAEFFGGASGVEVAQRHVAQAVDFVVPAEHFLEHQLRFAVGIDRALRERLVDRHTLGDAEGGAGGGEDEFFHAGLDHGVEQVHAGRDVVAEILRWVLHGLAHQRVGGEVHDRFRGGRAEGGLDDFALLQVALHEGGALVDGALVSLAEVIENHHLVARVEELLHADAADVPSAASDKDFHVRPDTSRRVSPARLKGAHARAA